MNCQAWEQEIACESESVALREHLQVCGDCRHFAGEIERNRAALRVVEIPPAAFDAVRLRVLDELRAKQRHAWCAWPSVAAAACIAVLFTAALLPNWRSAPPPKPLIFVKNPPKIEWTPVLKAHHPTHHEFGPVSASAGPAHNAEPLVVKMLTNDPNVIIIWLVDQKGDSL